MVFPSKHSRGSQFGQNWTRRNTQHFHSTTETKKTRCVFCLPCCGARSPNIHKFGQYLHTDLLLMFNWWFQFYLFFCCFGVNKQLYAGQNPVIPAFLYSGKVKPPSLFGSVFVSMLHFAWPKQHVSFPRERRSFHIVKANIDLFFFFINLHHLCFLIHIHSLTEVTTTQWGVRRVVLQGIPQGVILLMGSWMRSRSLGPAHLFALGPSRRTTAAAPDKAQVYEKFSCRGKSPFRLFFKVCFKPLPSLFYPSDKVELNSNGLDNCRLARHTPPPSSPSGRSSAASSSSGGSPSPGQDPQGLTAPSESNPSTTSGAEQTSSSTTESTTDSLPAG